MSWTRCKMDFYTPEFKNLHAIWPKNLKGRRNYDFKALRKLSALEWEELGRLVRQRIRAFGHKAPNPAGRRHAKELIRRMRAGPSRDKRVIVPPRMLMGRRRPCRILEALFPQRASSWVPVLRRKSHHQMVLKDFSLIDHPAKSFALLRNLAEFEATSAGVTVDFEDTFCVDVSAYLVLGLMTQNMIRVMQGGKITPAVSSMFNTVGLSSFMGVRSAFNKDHDPTFMPFKVRHRRPAGSSTSTGVAFQPSKAEELADRLVDAINDWLKVVRQPALSSDMMSCVANLVTEILDNAVRHSDLATRDGDWAIAGFLSPAGSNKDSHISYICSLAMVSVGATVHESLGACVDDLTRQELGEYVKRHAHGAKRIGGDHNQELLTTVFALQDGISRFSQAGGNSKGGVGLMDTVDFVNRMSKATREHEQPCMTLVSGRACLSLRGLYRRFPDVEPGERRQLWFNPNNTLEQPPDSDYVSVLPHGFPGTIVALRFCVGSANGKADEDGHPR